MSEMKRANDDGLAVLPILTLIVVLVVVLGGLLATSVKPVVREEEATEAVEPTTEAVAVAAGPASLYSDARVAEGAALYQISCAACHGPAGMGIQGLGKNLLQSEFIDGLTDDELHHFITVGRTPFDPLNTTGIEMPAKGVNPSLTDDQIDSIIAFVRVSAIELRTGAPEAAVPTTVVVEATAAVVIEATSTPIVEVAAATPEVEAVEPVEVAAPVFDAAASYNLSCAGCHGADGEGVSGITSTLWDSEMVTSKDNVAIIAYLTEAKPIGSTTPGEYIHPITTLTSEQVQQVMDYVYRIQPEVFEPATAYAWSCSGCHGIDGQGVSGIAIGILDSEMLADPDALAQLLTTAAPPANPETGFVHPVHGGYPALTDEQVQQLIEYVQTLKAGE